MTFANPPSCRRISSAIASFSCCPIPPALAGGAFIGDTLNSSLACGTNEDIPAEQIRKELGMSRNDFKDFLNDDSGDRLMTSREEEFRDYRDTYGFHGGLVPFFSMGMLEGLTVERIDWENWQTRQRKALPKNTTQEFTVVFSPDETQQKWIDAVQDGKKKEARIDSVVTRLRPIKRYI